MIHDLFNAIVYHLLLFRYLFYIVDMRTCFIMPCEIRIATFNLTITYLTLNQLLFCFGKYVELFSSITLFLALFKFNWFPFLYILYDIIFFFMIVSVFFVFVFPVFFCSFILVF